MRGTHHIDPVVRERVSKRFAFLFEDELMDEIAMEGEVQKLSPDSTLMEIGEKVTFLPLILEGSVKIMTEDEQGNEMLLYYLEAGDTCAATLSCCSRASKSKIRAVNENEVEVLMVPAEKFDEWMASYRSFRDFVLDTYNNRLNEMLGAIDLLAFNNMEERLFAYLRNKAMVTGSTIIETTHAKIAYEMHSSRVVISRLMKKLERDGLIVNTRNSVTIVKM